MRTESCWHRIRTLASFASAVVVFVSTRERLDSYAFGVSYILHFQKKSGGDEIMGAPREEKSFHGCIVCPAWSHHAIGRHHLKTIA